MSTSRNVRSFPANSELHRSKHPPVQYERRQNISSPPGMVLQHLVFDKGDLKGLHVPCEPGTSFQTPCPGMNMVSMKASPNNPAQYCCQYTRCASCRCSYCLSTMPAEKNSCLITEEGKPSMVVMPLRGELYTITDGSSAERHELIFNEKIVMEQLPCFVDYALWRHYLLVMFSKDTVDSLESRNQLLVVCLSSLTVEMVNFNVRRHWRSLLRWDKPGWKISTGPSAMILWAREPGKEAQVVVYCRVADEKPGACATSPIRRSAEESLSCEGEPSTSKQRSTPEPPRQEEPDSLAARIARTWPSDQGENGDGSRKRPHVPVNGGDHRSRAKREKRHADHHHRGHRRRSSSTDRRPRIEPPVRDSRVSTSRSIVNSFQAPERNRAAKDERGSATSAERRTPLSRSSEAAHRKSTREGSQDLGSYERQRHSTKSGNTQGSTDRRVELPRREKPRSHRGTDRSLQPVGRKDHERHHTSRRSENSKRGEDSERRRKKEERSHHHSGRRHGEAAMNPSQIMIKPTDSELLKASQSGRVHPGDNSILHSTSASKRGLKRSAMVPEYSRSLNDGAMGQERPRSGASSTRDACGNGRSAGRSNESQNPKAAGPNMEAVPKTPAVAQGLIKEKAQALDPKKSLAEDTWPGSPGSLTVETIYGLLNMLHPEPFVGSSNATVKDEHTTVLEGGFVAQSPLSAGRGREEEAETLLNPSYSAASSSSSLPRPDRDATDAQKHKISRIEGNVEDSTRQKLEQEFSSVGMEPVYPVRDNPESAKRDVTTNQPGSSQTSSYDYHAADIPPTSQSISCSQYSTSSRTRHQNEEERGRSSRHPPADDGDRHQSGHNRCNPKSRSSKDESTQSSDALQHLVHKKDFKPS